MSDNNLQELGTSVKGLKENYSVVRLITKCACFSETLCLGRSVSPRISLYIGDGMYRVFQFKRQCLGNLIIYPVTVRELTFDQHDTLVITEYVETLDEKYGADFLEDL